MAGVRLATGYIEISAETSKVPQQIQDALSKAGTAAAKPAGQQMGKDIGQGIQDGLKSIPTSTSGGSIVTDIIAGKSTIGPNVRAQGQKVGKEVGTGINEGIQQSTTTGGAKIDDTITKAAKPKETGKKIGTQVKEGINESMQDSTKGPIDIIKDAAKDWGRNVADEVKKGDVKGAFSDVGDVVANTTNAIKNMGELVGVNLGGVGKFGDEAATTLDTIGGNIQTVVDKFKEVTGHARNAADGFAQLRSGDTAGKLQGVAQATSAIAQAFKAMNIDIGDTPDKIANVAQNGADLVILMQALKAAAGPALAGAGAAAAPFIIPAAAVAVAAAAPGAPPGPQTGQPGQVPISEYNRRLDVTRKYAQAKGTNQMPPGTSEWVNGQGPMPAELSQYAQVSQPVTWGPGAAVIPPGGGLPIGAPRLGAGIEAGPTRPDTSWQHPYAAGEPKSYAPAEAGKGATSVSAQTATVSASTASISVGSASVSGVPAYAATPQPGFSSTPKGYWRQSGGDIPGSGAVPIIGHGGEHMLNRADVEAMGGQDAVYAWRRALHYDEGGAIDKGTPQWLKTAADKAGMPVDQYVQQMMKAAPGADVHGTSQDDIRKGMVGQVSGDDGKNITDAIDTARTMGFIPAGAGSKAVAGTSSLAGLFNLGNEAVGGLIDTGAAAAQTALSMAATAGSFGAGGQAAGALGGIGIQLAASEGKRAASYGFQMASILADSVVDQIFGPFGGPPRWIGYDYTQFLPNLNISQIGTTTVEKAMQAGMKPGQTPGGPVTPEHMAGEQPVGPPVPKFGQPAQPQALGIPAQQQAPQGGVPPPGSPPSGGAPPPGPPPTETGAPGVTATQAPPLDPMQLLLGNMPTGDEGGWLMPNTPVINTTGRPELMIPADQLDNMASRGNKNPYNRGGDVYNITAVDADDVSRQIDKRKRLAAMQYNSRP